MYDAKIRGELVEGGKSYADITRDIVAPIENAAPVWWLPAMFVSLCALAFGVWAGYVRVTKGIGAWGLNTTQAWGWDIINFVWWIGIGHAGTAFSIFLLILRQKWRTSINRAAEAMTVVAVCC